MTSKIILSVVPHAMRILRILSAQTMDSSLTFQQFRILYLIHDGLTQTEIADSMQVSTAAISKSINLLVDKNFVTRKDGVDRRTVGLVLTKDGQEVLKVTQKYLVKILDKKLKKLTKKELDTLEAGLSILENVLVQVYEDEK